MKSTVEKVSNLECKLNVQIPAQTVMTHMDRMYKGVQKEAHIKGFRQGKAPMATIKSLYGQKVMNDLMQELIQTHYYKALVEHKLEVISYPEFEFDPINEGQDFSFSAVIEIKPEVTFKKIEGLEVQKEIVDISETKINEVIENIRSSRSDFGPILEVRPAANGDFAVIDFEGFVDGKPLENGTAKGHVLELGSNSFIAGFEEGIIGMNLNDQKTLDLAFPNPYHAADLAGKPVSFKVTLKELKKKVLPELNDEFVAKLSNGNPNQPQTLAALKEDIKKDLFASEVKRIEGDFKNRVLKKLVSENPVEVPPTVLKDQKNALIEDMKKRLTEQGVSDEEFKAYTEKWDKDFENSASEMIQAGFLVDAIAKKFDLSWTGEELEKKFDTYASQTGIDKARIKEFYSGPEQMNRLTYAITEEKVIAHLSQTMKITEVSKDKIKESLG